MSDPFNIIDAKTKQLTQSVHEAEQMLYEMMDTGQREAIKDAEEVLDDAEYNLSRHLLTDYQEDRQVTQFTD